MGRSRADEPELRRRDLPLKLLRHYRANLSTRQRLVPPAPRPRRRRAG